MITENWNLMRVLRLVLGIIIIFRVLLLQILCLDCWACCSVLWHCSIWAVVEFPDAVCLLKKKMVSQRRSTMKKLLVQNKWAVAGLFLGAITGYAYWYFVGCSSGICSITSKP